VNGTVGSVSLPPLTVNWSIHNNVADVGFDKGTVSIKLNGDVNEDTDEFR